MRRIRPSTYLLRAVTPALVLGLPLATYAQQTLGSINGSVTDISGAIVVGAQIQITGEGNGISLSATSTKSGTYQFQNLPVGTYTLVFTQSGFESERVPDVLVQESRTGTINAKLRAGSTSTVIEVDEHPLLNQTDATNGYVLDARTIRETPLALGSFTQLATLTPGVSAELISGIGTNAGLGNEPIWANGQRDTSNGFQVNGVDVTNLFNGKSSSQSEAGRLSFNIGQGGATAGQQQTNTSVYGSNGQGLATPSPEFIQQITVNTSQYGADQGNRSGAQINVNTSTGTNALHGSAYGYRATNFLNADPYFSKQAVLYQMQANVPLLPQLHRYNTGGTVSGPLLRDKLFFFAGYEYGRVTDELKGLSQFQVPYGLTDDRSQTGILNAINSYNDTSTSAINNGGKANPTAATPFNGTYDPVALTLLQTKLPNGQYLIPSAQNTAAQSLTNNVTLKGLSLFRAQKGSAGLDYNLNQKDRLSLKYYYQHSPTVAPFTYSNTIGFPSSEDAGAQVGALVNTITLGSRINWEQRMGFSRQKVFSTFTQVVPNSTFGIGFPGGNGVPAITLGKFAYSNGGSVTIGPNGAFPNTGYFQNRWNPESNVIFTFGKHNLTAGANYSYTQLNVRNRRAGQGQVATLNFVTFVEGQVNTSSELVGSSMRYYRANEIGSFVQDQWRILPNLTFTFGARYDYDGGFTEKYGNLFNFEPTLYNVTPNAVVNSGFVVAGNNAFSPTAGVSNSTLTGRQWGVSPRVAFAFTPKQNGGKIVFHGAFGTYYDRGELFSYLSQPAGGGFSGPFGVTNAPPLVNPVTGAGGAGIQTLANPLGNAVLPVSSSDPAQFTKQLVTLSQLQTGCAGLVVEAGGNPCSVQPANFGAYARNNKLPYSINFSLDVQVQLDRNTSLQIGYTGNRGRHLVIPVPFNEPGIATPLNPIHGETASYGYEVLNSNAPTTVNGKPLYRPITSEPYNSQSGGNVDLRVPYVGYSPNATLFEAAGVSAYDSLQTHLERHFAQNLSFGASYTFSHALDEQSDIGLFFTGDNPNRLRDSYASADFDRTHIFVLNYLFQLPKFAKDSSLLGKFTNGWQLVGIAKLQSGQAHSLYDFSGAVGSQYFGISPNVADPVIAIKDGAHPRSALTGRVGSEINTVTTTNAVTGISSTATTYLPKYDPAQLQVNNIAPGQKGVPLAIGAEPADIFENDFTPGQRNIFRQTPQKDADISFQKITNFNDRIALRYTFDVFNVTNTTSFDLPVNSSQVGHGNLTGGAVTRVANGQLVTSAATQTADYNRLYTVPTSSATFGALRNTIGQPRTVEMSLHLQF